MNVIQENGTKKIPIYVKDGKVYFLFIYDIGGKIDLDKALSILKESEGATAEEILPRHIGSRLFKFTTGLPISWEGNLKNLYTFSKRQIQIQPRARFILWPNGYAGVEFSVDISHHRKMTLSRISHFLFEMRNDNTLREEAKAFVDLIIQKVSASITDQHKPTYCEDYVSVAVTSFNEKISEQKLSTRFRSVIAHIVRQEKYSRNLSSLSKDQVNEVWTHKSSYVRQELIIVTYDVAFLYGENNDDEKKLIELINLHMIELKTLLKVLRETRAEFAERHTEILKEHARSRFLKFVSLVFRSLNLRRLIRQLFGFAPRVLPIESMMCSIIELRERADAVLSASQRSLEITQDPFLSAVYRKAGKAFDLKAMRSQVKTQLESLAETYDSLIEIKRHKWGFILEIVVILLISVEVAIPVSTWTVHLIREIGWGSILNNPYVELLQRIFAH